MLMGVKNIVKTRFHPKSVVDFVFLRKKNILSKSLGCMLVYCMTTCMYVNVLVKQPV